MSKSTITTIIRVFILSTLLSACSHSNREPRPEPTAPERVKRDWLSDTHAQLRKRQVEDVSYKLALDLSQAERFFAEMTIDFTNKMISDDLTIDFSQGEVDEVWVNGKSVPKRYNDFFITIDKRDLRLGGNEIKVKYSHLYSDNGSGLYRYYDKADGRSYLYTHFEPYEANKLFPVFDQPNIRASYQLDVTAPANWTVITSVAETEVVDQGEVKLWHFPASAKISSYIFPLHAGPYKQWNSQFEDIPLRLFARQSVASAVNAERWFDVSKKGLAFFNDYFDYPYPFGKLDQLIIPDFNISGMENVAAITYTERVISRGKQTLEEKERMASLLLHEIAHMWFGDLVTIDWWSNLWLKESFATYMSNVAMGGTGLSTNAWQRFYVNTKQAAYEADSQVTTHAIQMPVSDTKNGVASFDAITYDKGASVLSQLAHNLGFETFKHGVRAYFKKYAYQATTLPDFINTLAQVAEQDLTTWTQDWLYKSGTNQIKVDFGCEDHKISHFVIEQGHPQDHPHLREHALNIGLYRLQDKFEVIKTHPVKIAGAATAITGLIGSECPDMVYPNHGDWGFVSVILDPQTSRYVAKAIPKIADPMLRGMFYQSLWDMVNNSRLSIASYVDLVGSTIGMEQDSKVLSLVHEQLYSADLLLNRFDQRYYPDKHKTIAAIEQLMWQGMERQAAGSDLQKIWFDSLNALVQSTEGLNKLAGLLQNPTLISGLDLNQDLRWLVLVRLAAFDHPQVDALVEAEKAQDQSHVAELALIAIDAIKPNLAVKKRWLAEFSKTSGRLSAQKQKTAMGHLFPSHQSPLSAKLAQQLIDDLIRFDVDRDQKLVGTMVNTAISKHCAQDNVELLAKTIKDNPQLGLIAMKGLKQVHQAAQHCVALNRLQ